MYRQPITEESISGWGFRLDDYQEQDFLVEIWPDHLHAFNLFNAMNTQWRIAAGGGVVGLDYNAIPAVMLMLGIPRSERATVFTDLRVFESVALSHLNKKQPE